MNVNRYVILQEVKLVYSKNKCYIYYDTVINLSHVYLSNSLYNINLKMCIADYYVKLPKWLMVYKLKDKYNGWKDVFEHHIIPYYFIF